MKADTSILVIGGGIIGATSAYFLRKSGHEVTIIDKDAFGQACSHGNCGFICPTSHPLPLCVPEALMKPFKSMFDSYSPFYVNPWVGPSLWRWLYRFALNCRPQKTLALAHGKNALLQSSMQLYRSIIAEEKMEVEWQQRGLLFVYTKESSMEHYSKVNDLIKREFSLSATPYDSKSVVELEPALKDTVSGGWHHEGDAHLRPDLLMSEFKRVLENMGVSILEEREVTGFVKESSRIKAVMTKEGELSLNSLVLATGALSPFLARQMGVNLNIQPGKGYSITTNHPDPCPKIPLILEDHAVAVTPFNTGFRLGSTMEFNGYDDRINRKRIGLLEEGARHYLRDVKGDQLKEEWYGWRPMSPNDLPVISRAPKVGNAWLATGHSMLGISMGPATGKLLSELMCGDKPHLDPEPYRISL